MLRKVKLYGELAKFLGQKTLEAEVHSAAQAIRFLVAVSYTHLTLPTKA